jgi:acyl-coenzyme A thioesterase PaaI-like protein
MKSAALLDKLMKDAKQGAWGLKKLNFTLLRFIPFNLPHKFKITRITDEVIETELPFTRKNLNHLKGVHACAMATLAEYTTGLFLLSKASSGGYRIIMKSIHVEYHYQAKSKVKASFGMSDADFQQKVMGPLSSEGVLLDEFTVKLYDESDNHVSTGTMQWQLKDWNKVKSKVA